MRSKGKGSMDLSSLRAAFSGRLYTEADQTAPFLTDWRRKWTGKAFAVAQPESAADVAAVMRWCHERRIPVVPQGGNTSLSGGATPNRSGNALLLSLTRLKRVRRIDAMNNSIDVEAGVTLLEVQQAANDVNRLFPLSLAAEGSCTIGGNLASNAGGVQVLRYGNARDLCLGLEVVTPAGELWNGMRSLRKDNTGYSLRDLYIGSEGTLGVITAATLKLFPLPIAQLAAFVAVPSPSAAVHLLQLAQARLGPSLTAFELMNDTCIRLVEKHVTTARLILAERSPWYVLIEISESQDELHANEVFEALLSSAFENECALDAIVSQNLAQFDALWALRENISEAQGAEGKTIKHDISLPISAIADFVEQTNATLAKAFPGHRLVVFGHVGDGNLHYNLSPAEGDSDTQAFVALEGPINRLIHDAVVSFGGSISAEHGLGVLRRDESARYKSDLELALMRTLKNALDPHHLMNPGKVLP